MSWNVGDLLTYKIEVDSTGNKIDHHIMISQSTVSKDTGQDKWLLCEHHSVLQQQEGHDAPLSTNDATYHTLWEDDNTIIEGEQVTDSSSVSSQPSTNKEEEEDSDDDVPDTSFFNANDALLETTQQLPLYAPEEDELFNIDSIEAHWISGAGKKKYA